MRHGSIENASVTRPKSSSCCTSEPRSAGSPGGCCGMRDAGEHSRYRFVRGAQLVLRRRGLYAIGRSVRTGSRPGCGRSRTFASGSRQCSSTGGKAWPDRHGRHRDPPGFDRRVADRDRQRNNCTRLARDRCAREGRRIDDLRRDIFGACDPPRSAAANQG